MHQQLLTIEGLGRVICGRPTYDAPTGLFVKKEGLQGWQALGARRREAVTRALTHGEHDLPVLLPARVITIDGWAIGDSLPDLAHQQALVSGWGASGDPFGLSVELAGVDLGARVRTILSDVDDFVHRRNRFFIASFQTQLLAADPRKYGEVVALPKSGTGTTITVSHGGNFLAFPLIEIPSAPSSYTITTPAGTYVIDGATSGGTHRVDMRNGRVTRNGAWMPDVGRGPLWACPDGAEFTITLSVPGRALMTDTSV